MVYRKTNKLDDMKDAVCTECGSKRLLYKYSKLECTNCGYVIGKTMNKYGAKKHEYNGHKYHSMFEAQVAEDLDTRIAAGELDRVERQVKIDLRAYGQHITNYFMDFVLYYKNGDIEYLEVKGVETDTWKMKWKMFEAKMKQEQPHAILTVLKQKTWRK